MLASLFLSCSDVGLDLGIFFGNQLAGGGLVLLVCFAKGLQRLFTSFADSLELALRLST